MQRAFEAALIATIGYVIPGLLLVLALNWLGGKVLAFLTALQALPI